MDWNSETLAVPLIIIFAVFYALGMARLWQSAGVGRGIGWLQAGACAAALALLYVALASPIAEMSEELFSAHMVMHEILMVVAAPLLVMSRPLAALAWAMPRLAASFRASSLLHGGWAGKIASPLSATLLQAMAIWIWHVPRLFRAATGNEVLHIFQHISFFASALLFWHAINKAGRLSSGAAVGYLFITSAHTNFLGALLTLSPKAVYGTYGGLGLSPIEDQQLGGIIMWVPGGMAYAIAALVMAARWIAMPREDPLHSLKPGGKRSA